MMTYVVSGQVWYLIVSIPDLCILLYFNAIITTYFVKFENSYNSFYFMLSTVYLRKRIISELCKVGGVIWYVHQRQLK